MESNIFGFGMGLNWSSRIESLYPNTFSFEIDNSTLGIPKKLIMYLKDSFSVDKIKLLIKIKKIIFFKYVFRPIFYY